ncbi:hypothetical protein R6Q59_018779, partial [Mikania micrantha]
FTYILPSPEHTNNHVTSMIYWSKIIHSLTVYVSPGLRAEDATLIDALVKQKR